MGVAHLLRRAGLPNPCIIRHQMGTWTRAGTRTVGRFVHNRSIYHKELGSADVALGSSVCSALR